MDKQAQKVMFSSASDNWTTPNKIFEVFDNVFNFTLDAAASKDNTKCKKYFTIEDDGLKQSWAGETVWCNPPYSQIKEWVKKSYEEAKQLNTIVALLIPARTDTKYWHDYVMKSKEIYFIQGRLKFGTNKNSAPFPSVLVVFDEGNGPNRWNPDIFSVKREK